MKTIPPVEVSRMALVVLVAAGVVTAVASAGDLSHFAAGFAAGAGSALVLSRLRRPPDAGTEGSEPEQEDPVS